MKAKDQRRKTGKRGYRQKRRGGSKEKRIREGKGDNSVGFDGGEPGTGIEEKESEKRREGKDKKDENGGGAESRERRGSVGE